MRKTFAKLCSFAVVLGHLTRAEAVEFEPLGKCVAAALGTTKAFKKKMPVAGKEASLFYSKNATGQPDKIAYVETNIYPPNCTHTWVVALDAATTKVSQVRVVEMSCPHAFPTRASSYLDQYKGKGPAEVAKLDSQIDTIAKATGSSKLATDAVKHAITAAGGLKGKI